MRRRLIVTAVITLAACIGVSSSAATTQTLRITSCLRADGNGGTFAAGSDIVATLSWNTNSADTTALFTSTQQDQFGLVTGPNSPADNRVFGPEQFVWSAPYWVTATGQRKNGQVFTATVSRSDLTIDLGVFTPGTYYLTLTSVAGKTTNDGFGFITQKGDEWLITSSCPFVVQ